MNVGYSDLKTAQIDCRTLYFELMGCIGTKAVAD